MSHTLASSRKRRSILFLGILIALSPLLACLWSPGGTLTASRAPRWACPSPTPKPYGEGGPIKKEWDECNTDPTTGIKTCIHHVEYYEQWEQEYGYLGGPPFPAPTPYTMDGTAYKLGQRVEVWPFHVIVEVSNGPTVPSTTGGPDQQLYNVHLTWLNHTLAPIAMDYARRVRLRSVTDPDGRIVSGATWAFTAAARVAAGSAEPPTSIPPGDSDVTIPILGPLGTAKTVEVVFGADPNYRPDLASTDGPTAAAGTDVPTAAPTSPPATATMTNDELRNTDPQELVVQWSAVDLRGPDCSSPGAITNIGIDDADPVSVDAPPGDARVVQIALNQLGKPYVWGAKGPEVFDCSGLTEWSYGQIGIHIPRGTAGQWPLMTPVSEANLQPGDLIFFAIDGGGKVDHVAMNIGDGWMVHAANPQLGVRKDKWQGSRYYEPRITGFRTARGGGS